MSGISKEVILEHGLTMGEYERIVEILGREPNMLELGIFSVMWSEHCSYKSSKVYLKELPTTAPHVIQGPGENAGIVDIGDGLAIAFKIESHNHPSYIEPYQGAATGVGGILRDIFTMGARPIAVLDSLRFGDIDEERTPYLVKGVVSGIAGYGNCIGVPTIGGETSFHRSYNGNCLVNVMCAGIVRHDRIFRGRASGVGNPILYVGSRTGRDGIHGATMASDVFGEGGEERRPTVQVGDPFTEKLLLEACLEAFKTDYIIGIQDMGAAGLTSSSVEMSGRGGVGMEIDVSLVPRREDGMTPYEVMLSESQERMLLVVEEGRVDDVAAIFKKWDLEAVTVGRVIGEPYLRIKEAGITVGEIPIDALTEDAPVYKRDTRMPDYINKVNRLKLNAIPVPDDMDHVLKRLISSPNISSKKWIYRQYDHMVRTSTVVLPGSDAAVLRIKGTDKAIALTVDCNSRYCYLNPFIGGMIAVAEAARNITVSGGRPLAITDCLNFGSPEKPEIMWQFSEAIRGIKEACTGLEIPVVSGNVSFYNETSDNPIFPTPVIGMLGVIEHLSHITTQWFKDEDDLVVLLGSMREEIGGSEYLKVIHGIEDGPAPVVEIVEELRVLKTCLYAIRDGIIKSAHDCSEGGLAVALIECCVSSEKGLGAEVELHEDMREDAILFGESQSRVIVTIHKRDLPRLKVIADSHQTPLKVIGRVKGDRLRINRSIDLSVKELLTLWQGSFEKMI